MWLGTRVIGYLWRIWAVTRNSDLGVDNTNNFSSFSFVVNSALRVYCLDGETWAPALPRRGFSDSAQTECHPQPRTKPSTVNAALLIDAPLREHKEPVTDCHKRLRRSEKRAAGACSRGLWIANVEHMKPVPGLRVPDFIMPPLSSRMISLFRHARLQRGPQLQHGSAILCSVSKMLQTLSICMLKSACVCNLCRCFLEASTSVCTWIHSGKDDWEGGLLLVCYTYF